MQTTYYFPFCPLFMLQIVTNRLSWMCYTAVRAKTILKKITHYSHTVTNLYTEHCFGSVSN